jgi:hypothetical protein
MSALYPRQRGSGNWWWLTERARERRPIARTTRVPAFAVPLSPTSSFCVDQSRHDLAADNRIAQGNEVIKADVRETRWLRT